MVGPGSYPQWIPGHNCTLTQQPESFKIPWPLKHVLLPRDSRVAARALVVRRLQSWQTAQHMKIIGLSSSLLSTLGIGLFFLVLLEDVGKWSWDFLHTTYGALPLSDSPSKKGIKPCTICTACRSVESLTLQHVPKSRHENILTITSSGNVSTRNKAHFPPRWYTSSLFRHYNTQQKMMTSIPFSSLLLPQTGMPNKKQRGLNASRIWSAKTAHAVGSRYLLISAHGWLTQALSGVIMPPLCFKQ